MFINHFALLSLALIPAQANVREVNKEKIEKIMDILLEDDSKENAVSLRGAEKSTRYAKNMSLNGIMELFEQMEPLEQQLINDRLSSYSDSEKLSFLQSLSYADSISDVREQLDSIAVEDVVEKLVESRGTDQVFDKDTYCRVCQPNPNSGYESGYGCSKVCSTTPRQSVCNCNGEYFVFMPAGSTLTWKDPQGLECPNPNNYPYPANVQRPETAFPC